MSTASERIQAMMRRFEEQAQKASELQSAMQDMQGTASSQDRSVTVTVAASGAVLDLKLAPNAVRQSANDLQQQIMATIRQATANAAEKMNSAVAPILGDQYEQFQQAFNAQAPTLKPQPDDEAPTAGPAATPTAQREPSPGPATSKRQPQRSEAYDDDDDFSTGSFLR
ncbi:YbaB/EbfC family nucleoid-associated protein [Saccharopolyspora hirsuta]|uniref:YbaB/EbfC family nucleoid-associated protein n=1 Tax=Saccharopolyspora hirsuta TaxID=1837 RepID=A0A5M7BPZ5_SACHI|nr:YbaB/EbfC family nucleoid-associated protein [Saccharopolyspora hirsuta]KAA5831882.1 YbaB/EbfC family nucleoid-associated protein [Saccharopolyspora hirsuta]